MGTPPPRLTVLAARDADVAVVVRRGPTDWCRLSLWDTATDEVTHGGWVHARVSGRRCDLSPDGRLFSAFLAAHGRGEDHLHDTWVAISRPPWWHALALWWNGTTWDAGACFPTSASCAVGSGDPDQGTVPRWFDTEVPVPHPTPGPGWTETTIPHNRRVRDGWQALDDGWWERPLAADGGVAVVRETVDVNAHVHTEVGLRWGEELVPLGDGASLDVSHAGRALVARSGRLEVHHGPAAVTIVDDLRDQRPDPQPPPGWARHWPSPHQG